MTVSPSSITVEAGGAATAFTATLTGIATGTTWSLDGPGALSTTSGETTSYSPPASVAQQTTATLTASAGSLSDAATITITPAPQGPPITVSGTVVDDCLQPVADVVVWIRNRGITRTDASGRFTFSGVPTPYDIGTLQELPRRLIRIYAGVSIPTVRLAIAGVDGSLRSGSLEGSLTVGSGSTAVIPMPLGRRTQLAFLPPDNLGSSGYLTDVNPYGFDAQWCGGPSIAGAVEALQWTTQSSPYNPNLAASFDGYGRSDVTVSEGVTTTGADVSLDSVGTVSLAGTVAPPAGYTVYQRSVGLDPGPGVQTPLLFNFSLSSQGIPASFTVPAPDAPGIALVISAEAQGSAGIAQTWLRRVVPTTAVTLGMDLAPVQVAPATGAEVDLGSQAFTWTSSVAGVQGLLVVVSYPIPQGGFLRSLDYQVFTLGREYRLPLPQELGLTAIPPNSRGEWHVGSVNEPTVGGLMAPTRHVRFHEGSLGTVLPIPESAEVRQARHLGDTRFTLP